MSEKVYISCEVLPHDHDVVLFYANEEGCRRQVALFSIINTQNARIAALEAQLAQLLAQSQNTFVGQPI